MRPAPSAPIVTSSTDSQNSRPPIQMPMPFGAGIGFGHFTQNMQSYPPQSSTYQGSVPNAGSSHTNHPQNSNVNTQANISQQNYPPSNYPPQNFPTQNYHQNQVPFGQGFAPRVPQNQPNIYPNLNHAAPFSYTHSAPLVNRSTSGFMRQVIWWC